MDISDFEPLLETISSNRSQVRNLLDEHLHNVPHTTDRKEMELPIFRNILELVGRKWAIEVLWELEIHGQLFFNQLSRHLENVTSKSLSDILKYLENDNFVNRKVGEEERPPKVYYSLTDKGRGFVELSMPVILFLFTYDGLRN